MKLSNALAQAVALFALAACSHSPAGSSVAAAHGDLSAILECHSISSANGEAVSFSVSVTQNPAGLNVLPTKLNGLEQSFPAGTIIKQYRLTGSTTSNSNGQQALSLTTWGADQGNSFLMFTVYKGAVETIEADDAGNGTWMLSAADHDGDSRYSLKCDTPR